MQGTKVSLEKLISHRTKIFFKYEIYKTNSILFYTLLFYHYGCTHLKKVKPHVFEYNFILYLFSLFKNKEDIFTI